MQTNFKAALKNVLFYEGGWSNHPKDPGGATMKGVTQEVYDAFRADKGLEGRSVRAIENAELEAIYQQNYWNRANCQKLPKGLDYAVFDYAVNSGVSRAVKDLQRAVGAVADGVAGGQTLDLVAGLDPKAVINDLCDRRMGFLRSLKTFKTFGKGWTSRVEGVRSLAVGMAQDGPTTAAGHVPKITSALGVKAPERSQAALKRADGVGFSLAGAGTAGQSLRDTADSVQPHISESPWGKIVLAFFLVLIVVGSLLIAYSYLKKAKDAGIISWGWVR